MKKIAAASAILMLLAGVASAAGDRGIELSDKNPAPAAVWMKSQVKASSLYNTRELTEVGLDAHDTVTVSVAPSSDLVDMRGRGEK